MRLSAPLVRFLPALLIFTACQADRGPVTGPDATGPSLALASANGRYMVIAAENALSPDLVAGLTAAGGTVVDAMDAIGIAVVEATSADFATAAASVPGVRSVVPDYEIEMLPPARSEEITEETGDPPFTGDNDRFLNAQWGMDAINAIQAWDAGYRGAGATVFILDSGIRSTHIDHTANLITALSTSFVPGEAYNSPPGFHGTHVAGIVAAADNGLGTIGTAPQAKIVAVKVLRASGSGAISWGISGLYYAANNGADVANMSFGATFSKRGYFWTTSGCAPNPSPCPVEIPARDVAEIVVAWNRAANYAHGKGVTMVAASGNDADNNDTNADRIHLPSAAAHVLSVSATGPLGWALNFNTDLDRPASYTNYGQSGIDFAGPGGDFQLPGTALCTIPAAPGSLTTQCWVFDMVLSTSNSANNTYSWTAGTSMASPHVAGVAALIVGANGGQMDPSHVEAILRASADDLGKPGNDDYYGSGRVNAARAVGAPTFD